jgi:phage replication-related protein YjqB (UPF0714/DUF867 family)
MSTESVKEIIGKAVADGEYRELLFSEADKALEGYELTEEESTALKGLDREKFDTVATELEERISRAGFSLSTNCVTMGKVEMSLSDNILGNLLKK